MGDIQALTISERYPCLANADKATPQRIGKILSGLREGLGLHTSASLAGISPDTLARWREADAGFAADVEAAAADFIQANVRAIQETDDWKAKAWLLKSSPVSKAQWGETRSSNGGGVNIVLGIQRDDKASITIDGEAQAIG